VAGKALGTITVDSWNNLWKYVDREDCFFIFDEQRVVGSGAWVKVFLKIAQKNRWILLSATPGDTWLDYIPVFVANGLYKNRTEFLREHVIYSRFSKFPKVERYIGVGRLVRYRNQLLVDMPYERHTTRHLIDVPVGYDEALFKRVVKDRWHVYENRPLRDVAELFSVMRKVANTHDSRREVILALLEKHPKIIVFYNFDYELELLRTLGLSEQCISQGQAKKRSTGSPSRRDIIKSSCERPTTRNVESPGSNELSLSSTRPEIGEKLQHVSSSNAMMELSSNSSILSKTSEKGTGLPSQLAEPDLSGRSFAVAEWNGHKHEDIPDTDRWVYLVQYTAGAEGWNCISTDAMVFYSLTYSYRAFEQAQGRIDRLDTPFWDLNYFVLRSESLIDKMIWKALKRKENFNERRHRELFKM
jgi:hypothetical protein